MAVCCCDEGSEERELLPILKRCLNSLRFLRRSDDSFGMLFGTEEGWEKSLPTFPPTCYFLTQIFLPNRWHHQLTNEWPRLTPAQLEAKTLAPGLDILRRYEPYSGVSVCCLIQY